MDTYLIFIKRKIFIKLLVGILFTPVLLSCASHEQIRKEHLLEIGDRKVKLKQLQSGQGGACYFNMHDNENTSVKAAKKFLKKQEGNMFYLKHNGDRNIRFALSSKEYEFDPNRIFTDEGIKKTMMRFGSYNEEGHEAVSEFANQMLKIVDVSNQEIMIALHNNTENRYCSSSYLPGKQYDVDAADVYQNPNMDHDDFYFVTDSVWYHTLAKYKQNVVLQDNRQGTDDGSLSIYCGRAKIPYINVEAQHGHKKEQGQMLEVLSNIIGSKKSDSD